MTKKLLLAILTVSLLAVGCGSKQSDTTLYKDFPQTLPSGDVPDQTQKSSVGSGNLPGQN